MSRSAIRVLLVACLLSFVAGCASDPRWATTRRPDVLDAASLLASNESGLARTERPEEVPPVPVRRRLRPCCGFGSGLQVQFGRMKVPGVAIGNIRSPDDVGRHVYDAGQNAQDVLIGSEKNGLVYTCRGGFLDIAHVRDYADWTLYLATEFGRHLETGGRIVLPAGEGGLRTIVLQPVDPRHIAALGRRELSAALAVSTAFRLSIWHEIATWYGWSSFDLFPERVSAFSPEDLYSNLLGAKLASAIINSGNDLSETLFNEAMDAWLAQSMRFLGAVPAPLGESMMDAVDGLWWDSTARLPDPALVLRRNFDVGLRQAPWIVPPDRLSERQSDRLEAACGSDREAHPLRNPVRLFDLVFDEIAHLEVELDAKLAAHPSLTRYAGTIEDAAFPELLEVIRAEALDEFGALADRPTETP
ncbi:MAG: DUF4056 domain-containing protein [Myxococcota bacterium]